ncbi:MAG TPA: gamma-glutamylcyclotransferase family protein [Polyangiaceae bacterium]
MHWVFAYGSNMDLEDLGLWLTKRNLPPARIVQAQAAKLVGYRLVWNHFSKTRGGGVANIEPADSDLPGVALCVDHPTLSALDRKEGYPSRYGRALSEAVLGTGTRIQAWAYRVQAEHWLDGIVHPSRHYKGILVRGATRFGLPPEYISHLNALETCD